MSDRSQSMDNFFTALEQIGFSVCNEVLVGGDVSTEVRRLLSRRLPKDRLLLFRIRGDVRKLCREEEKRMEVITGEPKKINDGCVTAVFIWEQRVGIVPDLKYPASRWIRYFQVDVNSPCLICMEKKEKLTMCSNCASIICLDCDTKIGTDVCPICTRQLSSFR